MMRARDPELVKILGPEVRFKYIGICQYDTKYLIRIDLADSCPNFHFLHRFRLLDVICITDFLSYPQPSAHPNIQIQSPVSFILGLYDKYAACILNVNNLNNRQFVDTKTRLEQRIANLTFDKGVITNNDFIYFYPKFKNISKCEIVQEMVKNIFADPK